MTVGEEELKELMQERNEALHALQNLVDAVDKYGVDHWDTDTSSEQVDEIMKASKAARNILADNGI